MTVKYNINGIGFKTDKAVQEHAKKILYSHAINSALNDNEFDFMYDYFKDIHHEWVNKLGCGIKAIHRIADKVGGKYRAFEIERTDGSKTDVSYIVANIKKPNIYTDFKKAMRFIIMPQILEFKKKTFNEFPAFECPITKEIVTFDNCHIDHFKPTFDEIVGDFINENGISDLRAVLAPNRDNQTICEVSDKELSDKFYKYHESRANLRVLSVKANLTNK